MYSKVKILPVKGMRLKKKISCYIKTGIYYVLKKLKITPEKIGQDFLNLMMKNGETERIANFTTAPIKETNASYRKVSDYLPVKYVEFEDRMYPIPKCYDSLLKDIYGNYMKLPPKEERHREEIMKVDFGEK